MKEKEDGDVEENRAGIQAVMQSLVVWVVVVRWGGGNPYNCDIMTVRVLTSETGHRDTRTHLGESDE